MSQYKAGTVSVTNGSQVVTGTGTSWLSNVQPGDGFTVAGTQVPYTVGSVDSDGQITLSAAYAGPSGSGLAYAIWRDFTTNENLPELSHGDIETATIWTRAMRLIDTLVGPATTASRGTVEKATIAESESGATDRFPDAAGVLAAFRQYGLGAQKSSNELDLGNYQTSGIYLLPSVDASITDQPPGGGSDRGLILVMGGQNYLAQVLVQRSDPNRMWFRADIISAIPGKPWRKIFSDADKASIAQAEAGFSDSVLMTPLTARASFNQYGLGSRKILSGDLDSLNLKSGFYHAYEPSVTNLPAEVVVNDIVSILVFGDVDEADFLNQLCFSTRKTPGKAWIRSYNDNPTTPAWTDWAPLYTAANIIGTASQSGGNPTGAIVEEGANSNGTYTRFADGTQICVGPSVGLDPNISFGQIYRSDEATWTLPAPFINGNYSVTAGVVGNVQTHWGSGKPINTISASYIAFAALSATGRPVRPVAIGRWF